MMTAAEKAREDAEFLASFEPKWLRGYIGKLLRIEERCSASGDACDLDSMPAWAFAMTGKLLKQVGARLPRPVAMTVESFGRLLGQKVCVAAVAKVFVDALDKATDAQRAQLTKFLGGPSGVKIMRTTHADLAGTEKIKIAVLKKICRFDAFQQGRFYRGFGEGLTMLEQTLKKPPKTMDRHGYMVFFAVMHWREIELRGKTRGWDAIKDFFVSNLPDNLDITEDAFVKMLQRVGLSGVGREGRPRKLGQQSPPVSKF